MKRLLLFSFFIFSVAVLLAQEPFPCGTIGGRSPWLKKYQANPEAYPKNGDSLLYVPLTIHLVGSDLGFGFYHFDGLLSSLCRLNLDFEGTNMQFYIEGEINYISNSSWINHGTVLEGAEMMFANNVPNTINCYIMDNPAGNCGYNLPYAGIALNKSCIGSFGHTWAHEIGHALSVQHPFLGWEGGVGYQGEISHSFSDPAPTEVYYDYTLFKDTLILDTLIIDTALVELVDRSNCAVAADGFCDTDPDYIGFRWVCEQNGRSSALQTDPNGETFRSDGSLIMGYSNDACQARFTEEQVGAMRANLLDQKADYLFNQNPAPVLSDDPLVNLIPEANELVQFDDAFFSWDPMAGATSYYVQISRIPTFTLGPLTEDYVVSENSLIVDNLQDGATYYWRVKPFNERSFCNSFSGGTRFEAAMVVNTVNLDPENLVRVSPTILPKGTPVQVEWKSVVSNDWNMELYTIAGQQLKLWPGIRQQQLTINTNNLNPGTYILRFQSNIGQFQKRLVVF